MQNQDFPSTLRSHFHCKRCSATWWTQTTAFSTHFSCPRCHQDTQAHRWSFTFHTLATPRLVDRLLDRIGALRYLVLRTYDYEGFSVYESEATVEYSALLYNRILKSLDRFRPPRGPKNRKPPQHNSNHTATNQRKAAHNHTYHASQTSASRSAHKSQAPNTPAKATTPTNGATPNTQHN